MSADPVSAQNAASASLARAASGQAFTLAFSDTLIVTAAIMMLGAIFVWALPALPPEPDSPLPHPPPPASTRPLERPPSPEPTPHPPPPPSPSHPSRHPPAADLPPPPSPLAPCGPPATRHTSA